MKDLMLFVHTHVDKYPTASAWHRTISTVDVKGAEQIPPAMPGTRLDEFDGIRFAASADATHVGVCHYRRRPLFMQQELCHHPRIHMEPTPSNLAMLESSTQRKAALEILQSHDCIQYRPFVLSMGYRQQFALYTPVEAWDILLDVLSRLGLGESLGFYRHSNAHVWCSLLIAKREVVADFSAFALNVAAILAQDPAYAALLAKTPRLTALVLERLVPLWVFHHRLKSAYVPMVILEKEAL